MIDNPVFGEMRILNAKYHIDKQTLKANFNANHKLSVQKAMVWKSIDESRTIGALQITTWRKTLMRRTALPRIGLYI